jgi:hypothetical protein
MTRTDESTDDAIDGATHATSETPDATETGQDATTRLPETVRVLDRLLDGSYVKLPDDLTGRDRWLAVADPPRLGKWWIVEATANGQAVEVDVLEAVTFVRYVDAGGLEFREAVPEPVAAEVSRVAQTLRWGT